MVSQELLKKASEASIRKDVPEFQIGDTVDVHCRIVEGDKERVQLFRGTVIARRGSGISETFTVRHTASNKEGVERTFPLHSPRVADVTVVRSGKVRRAKLYFLRGRVGKATRLKEVRRPTKKDRPQKAPDAAPDASADNGAES